MSDPAALEIDVEHEQGAFRLCARFSAPPGVTALFGRSGSGKTTLVGVIAGLVRPRRGRIVVRGRTLLDTARGIDVPRHRRRVGYVFQEGRLFPHLTVRQNLMFGRWFGPRGHPRPELEHVVELLGIGHLLARRPANLSGGEKQRVAIGRALLSGPELLLMDEPLAALDEGRKAEILPYLERLRDEAEVPIVYVSHVIGEVARLADTLVVLDGGCVEAAGPIGEVLGRLDVAALAGVRDLGSVLRAEVVTHDLEFGLTVLSTPAGDLRVPGTSHPVGAQLRVQIQARDVMLSRRRPEGLSALNVLPATISQIASDSEVATEVRLNCGGVPILARITRRSAVELGLAPGLCVFAIVKTVALDGSGAAMRGGQPGS